MHFKPCYMVILILLLFPAIVQAEVVGSNELLYSTPTEAPQGFYFNGKPRFVFYDAKGWLRYEDPADKGDTKVLSLYGLPKVKNSYVESTSRDGNIYILWRPKLASTIGKAKRGDKHVLFRASYDGGKTFSKPDQLNTGNGAFYPEKLAFGEKGLLYTAWYDERAGGNYRIYMNRSVNSGRNWLAKDVRISTGNAFAVEPFISAAGKKVLIGWLEAGKLIKMRRSVDGGRSWSKVATLPSPYKQVMGPEIFQTAKALLLVYYVPGKGVMVSRSPDFGTSWQAPVGMAGTAKLGSNGFRFGTDGKDNVCVMWAGPFSLSKHQADIFVDCSHDEGRSWDAKPTRLDTNTPFLYHSLSPAMAMDKAGRVAVAWQDARNFRPDIYLNYSLDAGKTWLKQDILIESQAGKDKSQFAGIDTDGKGRFLVTWEQSVVSDAMDAPYHMAYEELELGSCLSLINSKRTICPSKAKKSDKQDQHKKRLISRVGQFWKAYVDGDFGKGFDLFDPFYRARETRQGFALRLSQIDYLDFKIMDKDISFQEGKATVKLEISYEAKKMILKGSKITVPRTTSEISEAWIWIDGDWFKLYETGPRKQNFLPY